MLFTNLCLYIRVYSVPPVTVAERSKARTVFVDAGTVGPNPTQGMDVVCVFLCLCTGRGLTTS
jgi:hypothetical protein